MQNLVLRNAGGINLRNSSGSLPGGFQNYKPLQSLESTPASEQPTPVTGKDKKGPIGQRRTSSLVGLLLKKPTSLDSLSEALQPPSGGTSDGSTVSAITDSYVSSRSASSGSDITGHGASLTGGSGQKSLTDSEPSDTPSLADTRTSIGSTASSTGESAYDTARAQALKSRTDRSVNTFVDLLEKIRLLHELDASVPKLQVLKEAEKYWEEEGELVVNKRAKAVERARAVLSCIDDIDTPAFDADVVTPLPR